MTGHDFEVLRVAHKIQRVQFCRWSGIAFNTVYRWERSKPPVYGVRLLKAYIDEFRQGETADPLVEHSQHAAFSRFLADLEQRLQLLLEEADRKVDAALKQMLPR